jgi:hypothetical protein
MKNKTKEIKNHIFQCFLCSSVLIIGSFFVKELETKIILWFFSIFLIIAALIAKTVIKK